MKTVWKTPLEWPADEQKVRLPAGAQLLTVQVQGPTDNARAAQPCLWARVNPGAALTDYLITTCGTGHALDDHAGAYLGTFQLAGGSLVFHAFGREAV